MMLIDDINFITNTENIISIPVTFILITLLSLFIFSLFIKTILCIISAWVFFVYVAVRESNKILKYSPRGQTSSPLYLQPLLIVKVCDLYPTTTILYKLYCNFIFDITYIRVNNKKPLFSLYDFKNLFWAIFFSFLGLNKLALKWIKSVLMSRYYKNISDYLFTAYFNSKDRRKLLYFNKQWHIDSTSKLIAKFLVEAGYNIPPTQLSFIISCCESTAKQLDKAQYQSEMQGQLCIHTNPPLNKHYLFLPHTYNFTKNTVAYVVDQRTAAMNDFFGKDVAVIKFFGEIKPFAQIWENLDNIKPIKIFFNILLFTPALGLLQNKKSPESVKLQSKKRYDWISSAQLYQKELIKISGIKALFMEKLNDIEILDKDKEKIFWIIINLN